MRGVRISNGPQILLASAGVFFGRLFGQTLVTNTCEGSGTSKMEHYRADGVRITHDPYAPGMAEKYGMPGKTDQEGFDPYRDTVGPGIYGGIVKRDENGEVVIGKQYQNHNSRPGPVYAGGGYTPVNNVLDDEEELSALLRKFPDLVNDISTGGAQPLHMCGMSKGKQNAVKTLVSHGADIEAIDTYGFTPLHRMASNNLSQGAKALLESGADPLNVGKIGQTPAQVAQSSNARDVIKVLQDWGKERKEVGIVKIVVDGAGFKELNQEYVATSADEIPTGFEWVCRQKGWNAADTWRELNGDSIWFKASTQAYIYWNKSNGVWWIDEPSGNGVYIAKAPSWAPPQTGWKALGPFGPLPSLVATFRDL